LVDRRFIFDDDSLNAPLLSPKSNEHVKFTIPIEDIEIVKRIGEGANGVVYHAKWNNTDVAVKSLKFFNELEDDGEFEREAALLSSLRHPSIVSFYGVSIASSGKYMVVEYLKNGSLDNVIYNSKMRNEPLTLARKLHILLGVAKGMTYLHTLKPHMIAHRDLKPGNILLDEYYNSKVCDFGLSKVVGTMNGSMTTSIGTLFYIAPVSSLSKKTSDQLFFTGNSRGFQ